MSNPDGMKLLDRLFNLNPRILLGDVTQTKGILERTANRLYGDGGSRVDVAALNIWQVRVIDPLDDVQWDRSTAFATKLLENPVS